MHFGSSHLKIDQVFIILDLGLHEMNISLFHVDSHVERCTRPFNGMGSVIGGFYNSKISILPSLILGLWMALNTPFALPNPKSFDKINQSSICFCTKKYMHSMCFEPLSSFMDYILLLQ